MAKKKINRPNSVSPTDETIRIDPSDQPDPNATSAPQESSDSNTAASKTSDGHSTLIPDPDDTGDPESAVDSDDLDATITLESTVTVDRESAKESDDIDQTVAAIDVDQTVVIDPNESRPDEAKTVRVSGTVVYRGEGKQPTASEPRKTDDGTVVMGDSVLTSKEIGATVNPRELSADEAKLWNTVVGNQLDADRSVDSPAIDRTFSDRHFDRLRKSEIAAPHSDPKLLSDYRLNRKLGQGGMGDVYLARQRSLDRLLALKVIKPLDERRRQQLSKTGRLEKVEEERRMQFLAEAIITGDLDHPNIVPIHDVAVTADGELFYSMKRVDGTPWSDKLKEFTQLENLEVLLRVCDAVGFAHTRNVVHRDIKPENIMLGDFGVVMVMDWGLALPTGDYDKDKQASILSTSGLGGTPAFMAPEMATGPLEKITPASDIYLLGATLFMIVTGHPPHKARNVSECLKVVRTNAIREVEDKHKGELLDIALKAMATQPSERFKTVGDLQEAIREFISHNQSIGQTDRAFEILARGKSKRSLADFHRASQGFEEALKSWDGNEKARKGLADTVISHAEMAYELAEYESGIALLDEKNPDHTELLTKLIHARDERDSRVGRLRLLRRLSAAMLIFILVGGGVAMYLINSQKELAIAARIDADDSAKQARKSAEDERIAKIAAEDSAAEERLAKQRAEEATKVATQKTIEANNAASAEREAKFLMEKARDDEKMARVAAEMAEASERAAKQDEANARKLAEAARLSAQYEEYVSKIGLAKARLDTNDGKGARKILEELKDSPRSNGWEWRWLWQQANQSQSNVEADASVIDLSMSSDGRRGAMVTEDGQVAWITFDAEGRIDGKQKLAPSRMQNRMATSVAIDADAETLALGTLSGDILVLSDSGDRVMRGHTHRISDLQFSLDGLLVSSSLDRTVRVWNVAEGSELSEGKACWHLSPVRQIAITGTADEMSVAAATADESSGRVAIWSLHCAGTFEAKQVGVFDKHPAPVSSIALSTDGRLAASGDTSGNVWIWKTSALGPIDYEGSIDEALTKLGIDSDAKTAKPKPESRLRFVRLIDRDSIDQVNASSKRSLPRPKPSQPSSHADAHHDAVAHNDMVRSIQFSSDGKSLVTASDDYTLKLWDVDHRNLQTTMRGHGGWVVAADFLNGNRHSIVSASQDASVRTWEPAIYHGAFVVQPEEAIQDAKPHEKEISSARFSPDGTRIVTASTDHTARVLSLDPETLAFTTITTLDTPIIGTLDEGTSYVAMSMETDATGDRLYIGNADATIRIWDLSSGVELDRVRGTGLNQSFAVSDDGKFLLSGSSSPKTKAILWSLDPTGKRSPRIVHRLKGHDQTVTALAMSGDGRFLFTGDRGGYGLLWDARTGVPIGQPIENTRGFRINAARFSADSNELFIGADDEQLTHIEVRSRRQIKRLNHDGFVTKFSLSPDGQSAVTISELATETRLTTMATRWDLRTETPTTLEQITQPIDSGAVDGNRIRRRLSSATFDPLSGDIVVCQTSQGPRGSIVKVFGEKSLSRSTAVAMTSPKSRHTDSLPDAKRTYELPVRLGTCEVLLPIGDGSLITMNQNAAFRWDLAAGKLIKSYRSHAELTEASFSQDGKFIATASRSVKIWDASNGKPLAKLEAPHIGPVRSVAFAPQKMEAGDNVLATGGDDAVVRLWKWDPKNRQVEPIQSLAGVGATSVRRVCFSHDAKLMMAVGDGGRVDVWQTGHDKPDWTFVSETAGDFVSCNFSIDGKVIAVGSTDHRVRLWSLPETGGRLGEPIVLEGHADVVRDVVLIGRDETLRVFTASADDSARVWDPRIGSFDDVRKPLPAREIVSLRRHTGDVTAVDATADGQLLMTAGTDGQVILWPAVPPHETKQEVNVPPKPEEESNLFDALDSE